MELTVLDIKGKETSKKVTLDDSIFGIDPSEHTVYLEVKQYLAANVKERTNRKSVLRLLVVLVRLSVKRNRYCTCRFYKISSV